MAYAVGSGMLMGSFGYYTALEVIFIIYSSFCYWFTSSYSRTSYLISGFFGFVNMGNSQTSFYTFSYLSSQGSFRCLVWGNSNSFSKSWFCSSTLSFTSSLISVRSSRDASIDSSSQYCPVTLPLILWYVLIRNRARLYLIITHSEILHSKPEPE